MVRILDGKVVRDNVLASLKAEVSKLSPKPKLAIIQVGARAESTAYINQKKKFGENIGTSVEHITFPERVTEQEIIETIVKLNADTKVHGIIVQLPVPAHMNPQHLIGAIDKKKDVDGLNDSGFVPATARAVMSLLDFYNISVAGKHVAVIGRSNLVGKPITQALLARNATVAVCHRQTPDIKKETLSADIIIVAAGHPRLIGLQHVKAGQVVIDVGINVLSGKHFDEEIEGKKFVGDVDFDAVKDIVSAISPVPGGVGPMTVASLFQNLLEAYRK